MANAARRKRAPPATMMLLLCSTFFIILSGVQSHQCHWCGPLAEQVHRSRRAPPCDEPGAHLTTCDPGYPYCAIVATSPPYVESRYCVKIYQDECYPLFCNSTKSWRMTCPCRGNLCNGANTEREIESFAVLSKLVARTHNSRIKKRSTDTENKSTDVSQDEENTTVVEIINTNNVDAVNVENSSEKNYGFSNNSEVLVIVPDIDLSKDSNNLNDELSEGNKQPSVNTTAVDGIPAENEENLNLMQADEPMKVALDIKSENIVTNTESLPGKQDVKSTEIIVDKQTTPLSPTTAEVNLPVIKSTKATNDQETKRRENESKEKLPTAEALQHNDNQADKTTTTTTATEPQVKHVDGKIVTTAETTEEHTTPTNIQITTTNSTLMISKMNRSTDALPKAGKNRAPMVTAHIMIPLILVCILWVKH